MKHALFLLLKALEAAGHRNFPLVFMVLLFSPWDLELRIWPRGINDVRVCIHVTLNSRQASPFILQHDIQDPTRGPDSLKPRVGHVLIWLSTPHSGFASTSAHGILMPWYEGLKHKSLRVLCPQALGVYGFRSSGIL